MATIFSHPAVPVAIGLALGQKIIPRSLLLAGMLCSIAPDLDTIGFIFRVPYDSPFGHRGFTHSIVFSLVLALLCTALSKRLNARPAAVFLFTFASALSHGLIDAMTDGGRGVAFFWPFSDERYFFPYNPIPVSPIGGRFFSVRGLYVFTSELAMLWLPALAIGGVGYAFRKQQEKPAG